MDAYRELLDYLTHDRETDGMLVSTPNQVNQWWRQRSRMTLVLHSGHWRIEGPGSERAVVAFAKIEGDNLSTTSGLDRIWQRGALIELTEIKYCQSSSPRKPARTYAIDSPIGSVFVPEIRIPQLGSES